MSLRDTLRSVKQHTNTILDGFEEFATMYFMFVLALSERWDNKVQSYLDPLLGLLPGGARGQVETIITVVVIGVIAIVGILIYSEVNGNIDVTGDLSSSQTNLTEGFGDAMDLVPIVMIVLVAALVIGVISRFR